MFLLYSIKNYKTRDFFFFSFPELYAKIELKFDKL